MASVEELLRSRTLYRNLSGAVGFEPVRCILVRRSERFALFEREPTFVLGFLTGMAQRIVELTHSIPEVAARRRVGFIPMALSRRPVEA